MSRRSYKKENQNTLIQLAQNGDNKALEELLRKNQKHIFAIFSHLTNKKEDIYDLTQETLLKMSKNLPNLKDTTKFKNWLNQIIVNNYNDFARKNPNKFVEIDENKFNEIKNKTCCEPSEIYLLTEFEKIIKCAMLTLPQNLRLTLVLREFEGLSYEEIAKLTNTAIGTVKSRISRARLKLQNELKEFI